jgi:hypothetical protein
MFDTFKKINWIPYSVMIAASFIILITTGVPGKNALNGLISGYIGYGVAMLCLSTLYMPPVNWKDLVPFGMIIGIVVTMLFYLNIYFDRISNGTVSEYYKSFSVLSTIFLAAQSFILFYSLSNIIDNVNTKLIKDKTWSLLVLFGVINYLIIITLGVILEFYSTQG